MKGKEYIEFFEAFVSNVKEQPLKVALVSGDNRISYAELLHNVVKTSKEINKKYEKEPIIIVEANKNIESIVAILAVCYSGRMFVPVSNLMPKDRVRDIIESTKGGYLANSDICLDNSKVAGVVDDIMLENNVENFYTIYTSGTTGKPKGVHMTYAGAFNTINEMREILHLTKEDNYVNLAPLDFDLSIFDIFASIKFGGKLVLIEHPQDIKKLVHTIEDENVTIWNSVPTMLEMLNLYMSFVPNINVSSLRVIMVSGDKTKIETANSVKTKILGVRIISLGGATECGIWSTYFEFNDIMEKHNITYIPYGKAIPKQSIYILNDSLELADVGECGELYIAGGSLAVGYFNDTEKTKNSFVTLDKFSGIRAYKTGDLMIKNEDGYLVFQGRTDRQVKINGYRIELDEIENKSNKVLKCNTSVVVIKDRIVMAVENKKIDNVNSRLKEVLPEYMLPSVVVTIQHTPLTKNGKKNYHKIKEMVAKLI